VDVRVLGCSGTYPSPNSPASGYLISSGESKVWVDAGTGTFEALQHVVEFTEVDAMVITHMHSDHCLDVFPFYYALRLHPDLPRHLPVYAPAHAHDVLTRLILGDNVGVFSEVFDFRPLEAGVPVEVNGLRMDFALTNHPIPTYAVSVKADGHHLVYSSDTGPMPELADFCRGADSLIAEATWQNGHDGPPLHLTAGEAGELATQAGVGSLFLTHLFPTLDHHRSREEASAAYPGPVRVLESGMVLATSGSRIAPV
jgi:ribonuclease BN (tRNA processing enzyme)